MEPFCRATATALAALLSEHFLPPRGQRTGPSALPLHAIWVQTSNAERSKQPLSALMFVNDDHKAACVLGPVDRPPLVDDQTGRPSGEMRPLSYDHRPVPTDGHNYMTVEPMNVTRPVGAKSTYFHPPVLQDETSLAHTETWGESNTSLLLRVFSRSSVRLDMQPRLLHRVGRLFGFDLDDRSNRHFAEGEDILFRQHVGPTLGL